MAFSRGNSSISLEDIKDSIGDILISSYYLGIRKLPCLINSPIRKDNNPSVGIYTRDGKNVYWTDFSTHDKGSIYNLLALMWGCSLQKVLERIQRDFKKSLNDNISLKRVTSQFKRLAKSKSSIKCKVREWRKYDLEYWGQYGISLEWLKYAEVYPISHKFIIKDNLTHTFGADKYAYAYIEYKENNTTTKIYQPFNKKGFKWCTDTDGSVISLWTKVPKEGDKIVICSSLKDALCLWANTGIPALALQGEGYKISKTAIDSLNKRYTSVFIIFDNDEPGLKDGRILSLETGFTNLVLPQFEGGKDISDLFKIKGKEEFLKIIYSLFNTKEND